MKYADLHLHTNFSDGTYTVPELLEKAKSRDLDCIAITDHDTVEAFAYLKNNISALTLEVIPGVELTADYEGKEVHILGYFVDCENKEFLKELALIKQARVTRIYEMVDKLKGLGMSISAEDVFKLSDGGTVGRLHLARAMFARGCVCSTQEAFNKYIGDNGPAYVGRFRLSPAEAIKLIANSGGVAVLAHPYCLPDQNLIFKLIDLGLDGLEIYYPEHSASQIKNYLGIAQKYNLLVTGGSDCHGFAKPTELIGKIKLPYELVEKMKLKVGR